MEDHQT